jgi:hypothetical protein
MLQECRLKQGLLNPEGLDVPVQEAVLLPVGFSSPIGTPSILEAFFIPKLHVYPCVLLI